MTAAAITPRTYPATRPARKGRLRLLGRAWTAVSWTLTLAAAALILGAAAFFTIPQFLGWQGIIVLSGSMEPTLEVGGLAYVDGNVEADDVEAGDIITFDGLAAFGGSNITHRVIAVTQDENGGLAWQTRGDCCDSPDPWLVTPEHLKGRVVFDVPKVGTASQWMQNRENFYLVVWLPAGIIIAFELLSIVREVGRELRKRRPSA